MSLIVVGNATDSLEELMEPFWQDLEVEEYCEGEVSNEEKQRFLEYFRNKDGKKYRSFDKLYAKYGREWNWNRWRKDADGVWREYSTSNPQMQWDWYEVGGRWPGRLILKDGVENVHGCSFSWGWTDEQKKKFENIERRTDIAFKKDIANLDKLTSYAILINGEWIEIDDEGGLVAPYLEGVSDDALITCVDYHM